MPDVQCEHECLEAFTSQDYDTASRLLPLIDQHSEKKCYSKFIYVPLGGTYLVHLSAYNGWLDIVEQLITQYKCDPFAKDGDGRTALSWASIGGHLPVVKYLFCKYGCDANDQTNRGLSLLHWAALKGNLEVVKYLVECGSDIMATTGVIKVTPFHVACLFNYENKNIPVIKYLLSIPIVLNSITNKNCSLFPSIEKYLPKGDAEIVYDKFTKVRNTHPVGSFVNIFLLGNRRAGKTSLAQAIKQRPESFIQSFRSHFVSNKVKDVHLCTAGIVPTILNDRCLGNIIIHDFAGQPEYYSSHAAVIEDLLLKSGAVFLVLINLMEDLFQQVRFWSSVITNECQKVSSECHLIVIGSHADEVRELKRRMFELKGILRTELKNSTALQFPLDCRQHSHGNLESFIEALSGLCASIRDKQSPVVSLYCNFLYSIFEAKIEEKNVYTLAELMSLCNESRQKGVPLPDDITPLVKTLHSSGLILFLEDCTKSWIVVSKEILLSEVDGILFAPSSFVEHRDIASNTGIITSSALHYLFHQYSVDMLIAFFKSMKLCEELDKTLLQVTNLKLKEGDFLTTGDKLLFFPALIAEKRPEHIENQLKIQLAWCLTFTSGFSFSVRFLHTLLLHLAYRYSIAVTSKAWVPGDLERQCSVWINGIHWYTDDGIEALVEQVEGNQCVVMLMSCMEGVCAKKKMMQLHCELTKTIVHLQRTYCPILQCTEYLLSPKLQYPLDKSSKIVRYDLARLRSRISHGKGTILCVDAIDQKATAISELLPIEPRTYLSIYEKAEAVCDGDVSVHKVQCGLEDEENDLPGSNGSVLIVPHCADRQAIPNNLIPVQESRPKDKVHVHHVPPSSGRTLYLSDIDDVLDVCNDHEVAVNWKELGLKLGLHCDTLDKIDKTQKGHIRRCKREMLAAWLNGEDNSKEQTWSTLGAELNSS